MLKKIICKIFSHKYRWVAGKPFDCSVIIECIRCKHKKYNFPGVYAKKEPVVRVTI